MASITTVKRRARAATLAAIAFSYLSGCPSPSHAPVHVSAGAHDAPASVPLFRYQDLLWATKVDIGNKTLPFLFDTGAGMTVISPKVATEIHCAPHGRATGFRMTGERVDAPLCDDVTMRIGSHDVKHSNVMVLDLQKLLPPEWPELGGVISLKSFDGQWLDLDIGHQLVRFGDEGGFRASLTGMTEIPARLGRPVQGNALEVFIAAEPRGDRTCRVWFEVDSGNADSPMVSTSATTCLGIEPVPSAPGKMERRLAKGILLPIGGDALRYDVRVEDLILDGNLGAAWLLRRHLLLDLKAGRAFISLHDGR